MTIIKVYVEVPDHGSGQSLPNSFYYKALALDSSGDNQEAPRTHWLDIIAQDLRASNVTLAQVQQLAHDRPRWRELVAMVGSTCPSTGLSISAMCLFKKIHCIHVILPRNSLQMKCCSVEGRAP